jgi:hypothetical protein
MASIELGSLLKWVIYEKSHSSSEAMSEENEVAGTFDEQTERGRKTKVNRETRNILTENPAREKVIGTTSRDFRAFWRFFEHRKAAKNGESPRAV